MKRLARRTVIIDAPAERIWEILVTAELIPHWQPVAVGVSEISGRLDRVGESYIVETAIPGRRSEARWEVTAADRERVHEVTGSDPFGSAMVARNTLGPGGGGIEVTVELEYEPPGGIVGKFAERALLSGMTRTAENLKRLAESAPSSPAP